MHFRTRCQDAGTFLRRPKLHISTSTLLVTWRPGAKQVLSASEIVGVAQSEIPFVSGVATDTPLHTGAHEQGLGGDFASCPDRLLDYGHC